jgi:hypothetical protein
MALRGQFCGWISGWSMILSDLPSPAEADLGANASPKIGFAKAGNRQPTHGSSPKACFFRIMLKRKKTPAFAPGFSFASTSKFLAE